MKVTLGSIITDCDNGMPVMFVTEKVVDKVIREHADVARNMLTPLVRDEIRRMRRAHARAAEDDAFETEPETEQPADAPGSDAEDAPASPLAALRAVALGTFWCPLDRTRVAWGEATIEQHRSRAQWQRRHSAILAEDAERHELAIAAIAGTPGATCLNDVLEGADA